MNLAALGEENVRRYGEYVSLAFEGREWTIVVMGQLRRSRSLAQRRHRGRKRECRIDEPLSTHRFDEHIDIYRHTI